MSNISNKVLQNFQGHPFHLVSPSPWPLYTSFTLLNVTNSAVLSMHMFENAYILLYVSVVLVIWSMSLWFRDIVSEASFLGNHTSVVQKGINIGVLLFIVSEALFFMAIFWAFFHSSLKPSIELGGEWPPMGIEAINPFELPLLNTVLLLSSGATITYAHHSLINENRSGALIGSLLTLVIAAAFTAFQAIEYQVSSFTLSDGIFGSCFYFATGFHGLHVIVGTLFIGVGFWRLLSYQLTDHHHCGYESSILYWHFVDVVWLILYLSVYYGDWIKV